VLFRSFVLESVGGQADGAQEVGLASEHLAHGGELFSDGVSVGQVVHDYGDLCQAVTDLAIEQNATVSATEFRTLNRCLDMRSRMPSRSSDAGANNSSWASAAAR